MPLFPKAPFLPGWLLLALTPLVLRPSALQAELVVNDREIGWFVEEDSQFVWRYAFDLDLAAPSFHPLRVPGGPALTAEASAEGTVGGLHFAWTSINGVSYGSPTSSEEGAAGITRWSAPRLEKLPDGTTIIRMQLEYVHPSGRVDLKEYRDLVIAPVARNGKYLISWTSHFTAGPQGAELSDSEALAETNPQRLTGARSGLRLQLASGEPRPELLAPEGSLRGPEGATHAAGQAFSATPYPDRPFAGSLALLADPRNLADSHPWVVSTEPTGAGLVAAPLQSGPRFLGPGEIWELSYRIVLRPRAWSASDLDEELFRWLR